MNSNPFYDHVGQQIAAKRLARGMLQAKLAHLAGMSRPRLANIEAGRQNIFADQLWAIADALEMPIVCFVPNHPQRKTCRATHAKRKAAKAKGSNASA